MTAFQAWLRSQPRGTAVRVARAAEVSLSTIYALSGGKPLRHFGRAARVRDAVAQLGGRVTVEELCASSSRKTRGVAR